MHCSSFYFFSRNYPQNRCDQNLPPIDQWTISMECCTEFQSFSLRLKEFHWKRYNRISNLWEAGWFITQFRGHEISSQPSLAFGVLLGFCGISARFWSSFRCASWAACWYAFGSLSSSRWFSIGYLGSKLLSLLYRGQFVGHSRFQ